jgi:threonylcarbamoyladenosine tRNA methylthiotransferase MtaB
VITEVVPRRRPQSHSPSAPLNVALLTIGCKLNQAESEALATELVGAGCRVTDRARPADVFIINTCAVTHVAERKARHLVRFARRLSPQAQIIVTGCYAETAAARVLTGLGADVVLDNRQKHLAATQIIQGVIGTASPSAPHSRLRTRSFVKIQEGCNDVCAFCVVPHTRGRERSVAAADILRVLRSCEADGVKEVVLTGTQLGVYGRDCDGEADLVGLIRLVLEETAIPRLRLSSVQPQDVTPALLDLWEDHRLCGHFHIALQSGSDAVLARMRRRYTTVQFAQAREEIRRRLPEVAITTDVLVGFPGETAEDFDAARRFCGEAGFAALHVFPFSARPGTLAAKMPDQVSAPTKRERVQEMLGLGEELRTSFLARFQGRVVDVLCERRVRLKGEDASAWEGLTDNYIRVFVPAEQSLENRIVAVRLSQRCGSGFLGELQFPSETS